MSHQSWVATEEWIVIATDNKGLYEGDSRSFNSRSEEGYLERLRERSLRENGGSKLTEYQLQNATEK